MGQHHFRKYVVLWTSRPLLAGPVARDATLSRHLPQYIPLLELRLPHLLRCTDLRLHYLAIVFCYIHSESIPSRLSSQRPLTLVWRRLFTSPIYAQGLHLRQLRIIYQRSLHVLRRYIIPSSWRPKLSPLYPHRTCFCMATNDGGTIPMLNTGSLAMPAASRMRKNYSRHKMNLC